MDLQVRRDNTGRGKYVDGVVLPTADFPSDHAMVSATFRFLPPPPISPAATAAAAGMGRLNSAGSAACTGRWLPNGESPLGGITPSPALSADSRTSDVPRLRRMSTLFDYWGLTRRRAEEAAAAAAVAGSPVSRRDARRISLGVSPAGGGASRVSLRRVSLGSAIGDGTSVPSRRPSLRDGRRRPSLDDRSSLGRKVAWLPPPPTADPDASAQETGWSGPAGMSYGQSNTASSSCGGPDSGGGGQANLLGRGGKLGGGSSKGNWSRWGPAAIGAAVASHLRAGSGIWAKGEKEGDGGSSENPGWRTIGSGRRHRRSGGALPRLDEDLRHMCLQFFVQARFFS